MELHVVDGFPCGEYLFFSKNVNFNLDVHITVCMPSWHYL